MDGIHTLYLAVVVSLVLLTVWLNDMTNWIDSKTQQFPDIEQHIDNFDNTRNNAYIGVIIENFRNKQVENVVPIQLWIDDLSNNYWTVYGEEEKVNPIKWCLMPSSQPSNKTH